MTLTEAQTQAKAFRDRHMLNIALASTVIATQKREKSLRLLQEACDHAEDELVRLLTEAEARK